MSNTKSTSVRSKIIDKLVARINAQLSKKEANLAADFIRQFFGTVAEEDLLAHEMDDLYGVALSQWQHIYQRQPGTCKVKISNPSYESNGWYSPHTIVHISLDDMPFLVDSIRMEINRHAMDVHLIINFGGIRVRRDQEGKITDVLPLDTPIGDGVLAEAPIFLEIDRCTDAQVMQALTDDLQRVLQDVRVCVDDWQAMRQRVLQSVDEFESLDLPLDKEEIAESIDFLRWIANDHFTFLGCRDYTLVGEGEQQVLEIVKGTGKGVLADEEKASVRAVADLPDEARALLFSPQILIISKTNTHSTVHRPVYTDYIGVKRFDKQGNVVGELRIIGLYTSASYNTNPMHIPFLRRKVTTVLAHSGLPEKSHAAKALLNILETFPRDDLFQSNADELLELTMGILNIQERPQVRLFARKDVYGRFMSCLAYVPRERFNTQLRKTFQAILAKEFDSNEVTFSTHFSDSILARIHFVVRLNPKVTVLYDVRAIEARFVQAARLWSDDLRDAIIDHMGEEKGVTLYEKYADAFRSSYKEDFSARSAVLDIEHIENLGHGDCLEMRFYRPPNMHNRAFQFKLFHKQKTVPLSDILPILENMGLRVISERPYRVQFGDDIVWVDDFSVEYDDDDFDIMTIKDIFQEALRRVWCGDMENDGFNRLVLAARLPWREVMVLRAYSKYMRQIGFTFSQQYIEETLARNPLTVGLLANLFMQRLDPSLTDNQQEIEQINQTIISELDLIAILDEDRILRRLSDVINATVRTNYFQQNAQGEAKTYLSFKLAPETIPDMPLPLPLYEIFVYSPRFEGVHLRSAKVARGGLRWSDRREDFRTEVLGLMKAQVVKNAVIVPSGAKGGFVPKCLPDECGRDAIMTEVVNCYKNFIRGLLDITDNIKAGEVVRPLQVRCYDDEDPYLVVAADKGTATFSDTANEIAREYGFWLDDAFASGGSEGYDHKKMGITARGAWVSVERHFRELDHNTQTTPFTVVGIGDMAGDVFGNGMLLSPHIKLVAAFNHMHIFIDPDPDPKQSFEERLRLFNTPRVSWEDYNKDLISAGGGVFSRSSKSITLTAQIQQLLGLQQDKIEPNKLIRAILLAEVDLLWNGGIGTYVKAESESHDEVGDRANDSLRVNGNQLRCRVVGEGGNLGCTQLGRVEYALNGGKINTDFIDNSAGVDCSDHEVNIKILLNELVSNGDMTVKQRNECLVEMTEDVANLVLHHNYLQTLAISIADARSLSYLELFASFMQRYESEGKLNRALEFLPDEKALATRKASGHSLTRPEISVLLAYSKSILKDELLESSLPEDPYLARVATLAFPLVLRDKYAQQINEHRLKRDIIATQLSNIVVNEVGINFTNRLHTETGASTAEIVKAYAVVRELLQLGDMRKSIADLDYQIPASLQYSMLIESVRLTRRCTRWVLRNNRASFSIEETIARFADNFAQLNQELPKLAVGVDLHQVQQKHKAYLKKGVPEAVAQRIANMRLYFCALDIIQASTQHDFDLLTVAKTYFAVGDFLHLDWLRQQISTHGIENRWDAQMRESLRDDLDWQQRALTIGVLQYECDANHLHRCIQSWAQQHKLLVDRWFAMRKELLAHSAPDFTIYAVAVREILDLAQSSTHFAKEV